MTILSLRSVKFRLKPAHDLVRKGNFWTAVGEDPQFVLSWRFPRVLPAGVYTLTAVGGVDLSTLLRPSLYIDTGAGFNEAERVVVAFTEWSGRISSRVSFERPVCALRFDPSDGDERPTFALEALTLDPYVVETTPEGLETVPKVLLNLVRLLPGDRGAGGAGRVCLAFVRELPNYVHLRVAIPPYHAHLAAAHPKADFVIVPSDDGAHLALHLAWCDCYVDPLNALRPKAISPETAVIAILQDLQQMRLPQFFSPAERRMRAAEYGYAAARADRLIAISDYERENLRRFYGRTEVSVVHYAGFMAEDSGLSEEDVRAARERARANTKPYLIYPAVPWLHKNHEVLVQAIALLRRRGLDIPLALTNTRGKAGHGERISTLAEMLGVADLVERKAFLPERELLDLTIGAAGMIFPSLYEGFGIPLTDAMQLGVPIIAARRAATPEICGDAAAYFSSPQNAVAVADDLASFWRDADGRASLAEAGLQRAKQFSSARVGAALVEALKTTIANKKTRGGDAERAAPAPADPFAPLAVCVIFRDLIADDLARLAKVKNIAAFYAAMFGSDARVTACLDIALAADPQIAAVFAGAERVICYDATAPGGEAFAVQDFAMRHDDAALHLVTRYPDCAKRYDPVAVRALEHAMMLHPDADYAFADHRVCDYILHPPPGEIEGVLGFEQRRREGAVVFDALIRRDAISPEPHGSFAFLGGFATRARRLVAPEVTRS